MSDAAGALDKKTGPSHCLTAARGGKARCSRSVGKTPRAREESPLSGYLGKTLKDPSSDFTKVNNFTWGRKVSRTRGRLRDAAPSAAQMEKGQRQLQRPRLVTLTLDLRPSTVNVRGRKTLTD